MTRKYNYMGIKIVTPTMKAKMDLNIEPVL